MKFVRVCWSFFSIYADKLGEEIVKKVVELLYGQLQHLVAACCNHKLPVDLETDTINATSEPVKGIFSCQTTIVVFLLKCF